METPRTPTVAVTSGLAAVVDVLGTKLLSLEDAQRFVGFRNAVTDYTLNELDMYKTVLGIERLKSFTIGDTMVYTFETGAPPSALDVGAFCHFLRIVVSYSIRAGFPVRGAFAIGQFFKVDDRTVLGPAVADAASWYERADWIGVHATPHSSLKIQELLEGQSGLLEHVLSPYPVPMKDRSSPSLYAINWPKSFYVRPVRTDPPQGARSKVLAALTQRDMPVGTEPKYWNALAFFDRVVASQALNEKAADAASVSLDGLSAPPMR